MTEEKADLERFVIGLYPVSADGEGGRVPGLCGSNNHGLIKQLSVLSQDSWEHIGFLGRRRNWAGEETITSANLGNVDIERLVRMAVGSRLLGEIRPGGLFWESSSCSSNENN